MTQSQAFKEYDDLKSHYEISYENNVYDLPMLNIMRNRKMK